MSQAFSTYYSSAYRSDKYFLDWRPKPTHEAEGPPRCSPSHLISFLSLITDMEIDIYQTIWDGGPSTLGVGGTAIVNQTAMSGEEGIAFKRVGPKGDDAGDELSADARVFKALISEVSILTHPSIRDYPNIVDLEAICFETDFSYSTPKILPVLMFQKAPYGDLGAFVKKEAPLGFDGVMQLLGDILRTVAYLHSKNLIHGDLKPKNILVFKADEGQPLAKLADFGFSLQETDTAIKLPVSMGWNAPEVTYEYTDMTFDQARRADIFSLGLVALFLFHHVGSHGSQSVAHGNNADPICEPEVLTRKREVDWCAISDRVRIHGSNISTILHVLQYVEPFTTEYQVHKLKMFLESALSIKPQERASDCFELLKTLHLPASTTSPIDDNSSIHDKAPSLCGRFRIAPLMSLIADLDYRIRNRVNEMLYRLKDGTGNCMNCSQNAALQLAACVKIGFGTPRDKEECQRLLLYSGRSDADLETILRDIRNTGHGINLKNLKILQLLMDGHLEVVWSSSNFRHVGDLDTSIGQLEMEMAHVEEFLGATHTVTGQLCIALADIYERRREYIKWATMCEKMIAQFDEYITTLEDDDDENPRRRRAELLTSVASAYLESSRFPEALEAVNRALSEWRLYVDDDHMTMIGTTQILARIYAEMERYDEAIELMETMIRNKSLTLGAQHIQIQSMLKVLAGILEEQQQYAKAEMTLLQALEMNYSTAPHVNYENVAIKHQLGHIYWYQGKFGPSLTVLEEVKSFWDSYRGHLGQVSPEYPLILASLADTLFSLDRDEEALSLAVEAVRLSEQFSDDTHIHTLNTLVSIRCYLCDFEGLDAMSQGIVDSSTKLYGPNHPGVLRHQRQQAKIFAEQEHYTKAEELLRQIVKAYETLNLQHTWMRGYYSATWDLADIMRTQKKWEDAVAYFSRAVDLSFQVNGEKHPEYWADQDDLADVRSNGGDWAHRLTLRLKAADLAKTRWGEESVQAVDAMVDVARAHFELSNFKAGEELYKIIMPIQVKIGGHGSAKTLRYRSNLAFSMGMVGFTTNNMEKRKESLKMTEEIYVATVKMHGVDHEDSQKCVENLMFSYKLLGYEKDAARLYGKLKSLAGVADKPSEEDGSGDEWETDSEDDC
ncbi:kinase-like protein [Ophiobolus disseminans]|uniref:Kinase-like protein n=1 Tax=Ophiobolus disseminans TaxID=1469910 RepID=A0A6A7A0Y9_9PLEO|nr:kinase-like protein [Ophiobolus disseminans]